MMRVLHIFLVLGLCHTVVPAPTQSSSEIDYQLPKHIVPVSYKIKLSPNLKDDFNYKGSITIHLKVLKPSKSITLHAKNLRVPLELSSLTSGSNVIKPLSFEVQEERQFLVIHFENEISGEYDLNLSFEGSLTSVQCGLCANSYHNGMEQVWYAKIRSAKIGARRVFPCFDEPHLKVTFDISVVHEKRYNVISSSPLHSSNSLGEESVESVFETTPPLSTFSFFVLISDFVSQSSDNDRLIIWTKPNAIAGSKTSYEIEQKALDALEKYFGLPVPSKKLNLILMPDDTFSRTSYWGNILLSEGSTRNASTPLQETQLTGDIVRLFIDQWFFHLVSPALWEDYWINMGMAKFFEPYVITQIKPELRSMDYSVASIIQENGYLLDQNKYLSRPLKRPAHSPNEINRKIAIEDIKGYGVIRMIQHVVTDNVFHEGIQRYLEKYSHKAAGTNELFETWNEVAGRHNVALGSDLKTIMNTWIEQKGYPIVTVTRNYESGSALLTQNRLVDPEHSDGQNYKWWIPINYINGANSNINDTTVQLWMKPNQDQSVIESLDSSNSLILNKYQTGFYRVNYDKNNWISIANYLNSNQGIVQIPVVNRAQLMKDVLEFVQKGLLDHEILVEMTAYLSRENDMHAWYAAFHNFDYILVGAQSTKYAKKLKGYLLSRMQHLIDNKSTNVATNELVEGYNLFVSEYTCFLNHPSCAKAALEAPEVWTIETAIPDFLLWSDVFKKLRENNRNQNQLEMLMNLINTHPKMYVSNDAITKTKDLSDPEKNWFLSPAGEKYMENFLNKVLN